MCTICDKWRSKKITSEKAFSSISKILKISTNQRQIEHLVKLSDEIMDSEVPLSEQNQELDEVWWNQTHKKEE